MKIRIAIEQKVKDSFEAAKFKERYDATQIAMQQSVQRQE